MQNNSNRGRFSYVNEPENMNHSYNVPETNQGASPAPTQPKMNQGTSPYFMPPKANMDTSPMEPKMNQYAPQPPMSANRMPSYQMPSRMPNQQMPDRMGNQPMSNDMTNQIANLMENQLVYPEIFYKLQPFTMAVCDQMDTYGSMLPTQEMVEKMTDNIYDDVVRTYPDLAEYAREAERRNNDMNNNPDSIPVVSSFGGTIPFSSFRPFGRRFRRRGAFRDLIDILILQELFRRRRRPWQW